MRIGICDDNFDYRDMVRQWFHRHYPDIYTVFQFSSGEAVLDYLEKNSLDVLFLDIRMDGINGIETARRIRLRDRFLKIIALTDFKEYAHYGYDVEIHQYIIKKEFETRIAPIFDKLYMSLLDIPENIFHIKTSTGIARLIVSDVQFIESMLRKKIVRTKNGSIYEIYGTMEEIASRLKPHRFIQIHKSYIINSSYVRRFNRENVTINIGKSQDLELIISRTYAKSAYNELMTYLS